MRCLLLLMIVLLVSSVAVAEEDGRLVELEYKSEERMLTVYVNEKPVDWKSKPFYLNKNDFVTIELIGIEKTEELDIKVAATGATVEEEFRDTISRMFPPYKPKPGEEGEILRKHRVTVEQDLLPGGKLMIKFIDKRMDKSVRERDFAFPVKYEYPWFFTSTGIVLTTAHNPEMSIIKSDSIVTFQQDGIDQTAYVPQLRMENDDDGLRPIQTVVQFLNFRIYEQWYGSLGFPLNQTIFEEPLLGVSYFSKFKSIGFTATAGIHFSKETYIVEDSGFQKNQSLDPAAALTEDDIPTDDTYEIRYYFGVSFKL